MVEEHYFSSNPAAPKKTVSLAIDVGGTEVRLDAASGTFSSSRLDSGTAVLLKQSHHFPKDGNVLDIGCGWGPVGISIAKLSPSAKVFGIDVNQRSIDQSNSNATLNGLKNFVALKPQDLDKELRFSAIWSNPPIRVGKQVLHELMDLYIPRLEPGGSAYLVVAKSLGADSFQRWLTERFPTCDVSRIANDKGYRVISLTMPPGTRVTELSWAAN